MKIALRVMIALLIAGGLVLSAAGYLDQTIRFCGMGYVSDANEIYLKNSFDSAVKGFVVLSAIKSGLAIIEGSEVGIGFSLELGDVVQSVYDYVDIAWKTALAGGTVLLLTRLMLEAVVLFDHWCLTFLFAALLGLLLMGWAWPKRLRTIRLFQEAVAVLAVLCATLYLVLPLSITGASYLSKRISQPLIQDANEDFASIQSVFSAEWLSRNLFPEDPAEDDSWHAKLGSLANFKVMRERLKATSAYFSERTRDIAVWTMKLVAGYLFDCIIFPVTFFLILFIFTRSMLSYLIGSHRQVRLKEDIEGVLAQYRPISSPS